MVTFEEGSGGGQSEVVSIRGHSIPVTSEAEAEFYHQLKDDLTREYHFTETSDLADLDRVLLLELQIFRLNYALGSGESPNGIPLEIKDYSALSRAQHTLTDLLTQAKNDLGVSRKSREAAEGDTVAGYLVELRRRAAEFGVHRNQQTGQAMAWLWEIISRAETLRVADAREVPHLDCRTPDELVDWIRTEVHPKWQEMDDHFKANGQKLWVGTL